MQGPGYPAKEVTISEAGVSSRRWVAVLSHLVTRLSLAAALFLAGCAATRGLQAPLAVLPFENVGEKIFLTGLLDGHPVSIQFDTGAESPVISTEAAGRLGIAANSSTENEGGTGKAIVPASTGRSMALGAVKLHDLTLTHLEIGDYEGHKRDIIIGYDLLRDHVVQVDHDANRIRVFTPDSRFEKAGTVQSITLWGASAVLEGDLELMDGERIRGRFLIDTGGVLPLLLHTPFATKHQLAGRIGKTNQGSVGGSDGGEITTFRGRVARATIAGHAFSDFPVRFASNARVGVLSSDEVDGLLGSPVLRKFNITYDYSRKRTYWEPNHHFRDPVR